MSKQVYISADYDSYDGDQDVVEVLKKWGADDKHKVDFIDMSEVRSGTVANDPDCRICELKDEFNRQINSSSAVIFVVGNKSASRDAGRACSRLSKEWYECYCTPYKGNALGQKLCKYPTTNTPGPNDNYGCVNTCSYLEHEFRQAVKKNKPILIVYNSTRCEKNWLPSYMTSYEDQAVPFWVKDYCGNYKGNYVPIKEFLSND